jgi:hypothetical protein
LLGNIIPGNRVTPTGINLLRFFPIPTLRRPQ